MNFHRFTKTAIFFPEETSFDDPLQSQLIRYFAQMTLLPWQSIKKRVPTISNKVNLYKNRWDNNMTPQLQKLHIKTALRTEMQQFTNSLFLFKCFPEQLIMLCVGIVVQAKTFTL